MIPISDSDLHAWVDGQLDAHRAHEVHVWLQSHPAERERVEQWSRQRAMIAGLDADVLEEPLPASLMATLDGFRTSTSLAQAKRSVRPMVSRRFAYSLAAAFALAGLGLGWFVQGLQGSSVLARRQAEAPRFVRDAAAAYAVFSPEIRHPVEVAIEQREHLLQWLSKRLGRSLKAPALESQGFVLLGGRLLPAEAGATAQFMYQNDGGERITLYVSVRHDSDGPGQTAFRFAQQDGASSFYWVDGGMGYAVTGQLPRERILAIAKLAYSQLSE